MRQYTLLLFLPAILAAQPNTPACNAPGLQLLVQHSFILCYSGSHKTAIWTQYELLPNQQNLSTRPKHFRQDPALSTPQASNADYTNSGYSRGHLVPAEDLPDPAESFLLTNAVPQNQIMNAGIWRQLENRIRKLAAHSDSLTIITGPIEDASQTEFIGSNKVAVPTHLFKVILAIENGTKTMYAAIIPNAPQPESILASFAVTVDEVQRRTGVDFFSSLDDAEELRLESTIRSIQ